MAPIFLRGLLIGFSIAAPVGPIGLLCIRRTLARRPADAGLVSGLRAATADAFYGAVAGFRPHGGVPEALVAGARRRCGSWAGAFLCCLGVRTFLARPAQAAALGRAPGAAGRPIASTLGLDVPDQSVHHSLVRRASSPGRGWGAADPSYASAALLVVAVFIGSALLWWLILSGYGGSAVPRAWLTPAGLRWVNRLSAVILAGFVVAASCPSWPGRPALRERLYVVAPLHRVPVHVLHERPRCSPSGLRLHGRPCRHAPRRPSPGWA